MNKLKNQKSFNELTILEHIEILKQLHKNFIETLKEWNDPTKWQAS